MICVLFPFQAQKHCKFVHVRPRKIVNLFNGRTDLPSRVGPSGYFFTYLFFFLSFGKNDSPKTCTKEKKSDVFREKF